MRNLRESARAIAALMFVAANVQAAIYTLPDFPAPAAGASTTTVYDLAAAGLGPALRRTFSIQPLPLFIP